MSKIIEGGCVPNPNSHALRTIGGMLRLSWRNIGCGLAFAIAAVGLLGGVLWFVLVVMQGAGTVIYLRGDGVPTSAIATLAAGGVLVVAVPFAYLLGRWAERRG